MSGVVVAPEVAHGQPDICPVEVYHIYGVCLVVGEEYEDPDGLWFSESELYHEMVDDGDVYDRAPRSPGHLDCFCEVCCWSSRSHTGPEEPADDEVSPPRPPRMRGSQRARSPNLRRERELWMLSLSTTLG